MSIQIRFIIILILSLFSIGLLIRHSVRSEGDKLDIIENYTHKGDSLKLRISQLEEIIRVDSISHVKQSLPAHKFQKRYDSLKKALDYDPEKYRENGQ